MKFNFGHFIHIILIVLSLEIDGQFRPLPPELSNVTVFSDSGYAKLTWTLSPSPDITYYVLHSYRKNLAFPLDSNYFPVDTIFNPLTTSYNNYSSVSSYYAESYLIEAHNNYGDREGKGALSNELHTMFAEANADTCNKKITVRWNSYKSYPRRVLSYTVLSSLNGGSFAEAGQVSSSEKSFTFSNFTINAQYCFVVKALLEGGTFSNSNKICLTTRMQRPPQWINADFATIDASQNISLSFTFDLLSEISLFRLERRSVSSGDFSQIALITSKNGLISYTDKKADISKINYYRLSAINNCNLPVVFSNTASNIVPLLQNINNEIRITWNPYKEWLGNISNYKVYINTGDSFTEKALLSSQDTVFSLNYPDIMYQITDNNVCFYISALETGNPFGIPGESHSSIVCSEILENIYIPTAFTPNNDMINDFFKPVLSFTPVEYHLIISDRQNKILFDTHDYLSAWDGSVNGKPLQKGVYLWFLKIKAPSGKTILKTGTVTIIHNR
jgi:gliding motility-associated-like protein